MLFEERKSYGKQYCEILPLLMAGGALASIGGSIFGGIMGQRGADKQAQAAAQASGLAVNTLASAWTATHDTTKPFIDVGMQGASSLLNAPRNGTSMDAYTAPYRQLGGESAALLQNLLTGGDVGNALQESPLYKFQQDQGERAINRQLAARGLYNSGAGLETLSRFNAQLQAEEGDRLFGRLFGAAQMGQGSAQFSAQLAAGQEQSGFDRMLSLAGMGANLSATQAGLYNTIASNQAQAQLGAGAQIGAAQNQGYQSLAQMGQGIGQSVSGFAGGLGNYMMYRPLLQAQQGNAGAGRSTFGLNG